MSFRNPFTTSYLYKTTSEERDAIADVLTHMFDDVQRHGDYYITGLHRAGHPGSLLYEELDQLTDALYSAGVHTSFYITFAGESQEDRLIWEYIPEVGNG